MQPDYDESIKIFLADEPRLLAKLDAAVAARDLNAAFRIFHTLKGNAAVFGLTAIEEHAAAAEDLLEQIRKGSQEWNDSFAQTIADAVRVITADFEEQRQLYNRARSEHETRPRLSSAPSQSRFFLSSKVGSAQVLFPCDVVIEVLKEPQVFEAPRALSGSATDTGLIGLVRCSEGMIPLYRSSGLVAGATPAPSISRTTPPWVIVLRGEIGAATGSRVEQESVSFSVAVDEVGEVTEHLFELSQSPTSTQTKK